MQSKERVLSYLFSLLISLLISLSDVEVDDLTRHVEINFKISRSAIDNLNLL